MKRLGKLLHLITFPFVRLYLRRNNKPRARVWLSNEEGKILLVKSWFGHQRWSLPGGGVEKGETLRQAARRELEEETGIILDEDKFSELTHMPSEGNLFTAVVFTATTTGEPLPKLPRGRQMEIIDRMWVDPRELPLETSPIVRAVAKMLVLAS